MRTQQPVWLFDLDDTLHNASAHIFPHINQSMTDYLARHLALDAPEADRLRRHYWQRYGATMLGLMRHHGTDPRHFLHHTHQFPDLARMVVYDRALRSALRRLPGRKIVVSNGPRSYAHEIVRLIGLQQTLDDVFGVEDLGFQPKPLPAAYRRVLHSLRVPASRCIMVEDSLANLRTAKALGMRTVWISQQRGMPAYVDRKLRSAAQLARLAAWR